MRALGLTAEFSGYFSLVMLNFNGFIVPFSLKIALLNRENGRFCVKAAMSALTGLLVLGGCLGVVSEVCGCL